MVLLEEISEEGQSESPVSEHSSSEDPQDELREKAESILAKAGPDPAELADALEKVLVEVVKPLFSTSKHPQLTSTGRKNLVLEQQQVGRFNHDSFFDDTRPWKNNWTTDLLRRILSKYEAMNGEQDTQRKIIESHFHLLIPPILNHIDDVETVFKVEGCHCLQQLCENLTRSGSNMMKRTGLTDVFVDALKKTFTYLPTLTPESESLQLMQAVYPAYLALIQASYVSLSNASQHHETQTQGPDARPAASVAEEKAAAATELPDPSETTSRQVHLTILLRHSLLYALSHLSIGTGHGTSQSIPISTFLLSQIPKLTLEMGIYMVSHLQSLIPFLVNILCDPFSTSAPLMLREAVVALRALVTTCWPRVRERWWTECLSGQVGCWLNILDDLDELSGARSRNALLDVGRRDALLVVQGELRKIMVLLEDIVEKNEFAKAKSDLLAEEPSLGDLFNHRG